MMGISVNTEIETETRVLCCVVARADVNRTDLIMVGPKP
jgi:hypothetical protein